MKNFIDELNIWKNKNNISNVDFVVLDALDENFQKNIDLGFSLVFIFGVLIGTFSSLFLVLGIVGDLNYEAVLKARDS